MTGPENTSFDREEAARQEFAGRQAELPNTPVEHELGAVVAETNTLYLLPDDVLMLPCRDQIASAVATKLDGLKDIFDLTELVITDGIDRPWILRKGVPISPDGNPVSPQ